MMKAVKHQRVWGPKPFSIETFIHTFCTSPLLSIGKYTILANIGKSDNHHVL